MSYSSLVIANEFIRRGLADSSSSLTQMQVQKLVYLSHGWALASFDEPLIEDQVEAWRFGPVIRKLYSALVKYGSGQVRREIRWGEDTILIDSDHDGVAREDLAEWDQSIVNIVWDTYGSYPAFKLSALTHQPETPWSQTYQEGDKKIIDNDLIKDHFKTLMAA